jgi:hypothetical protein
MADRRLRSSIKTASGFGEDHFLVGGVVRPGLINRLDAASKTRTIPSREHAFRQAGERLDE